MRCSVSGPTPPNLQHRQFDASMVISKKPRHLQRQTKTVSGALPESGRRSQLITLVWPKLLRWLPVAHPSREL